MTVNIFMVDAKKQIGIYEGLFVGIFSFRLFPIPEGRGLNSQAQPLTEYEAKVWEGLFIPSLIAL